MTETFEFLSSVLPEDGYPVITYSFTVEETGEKVFRNRAFDDIQSAASFATWLDRKGSEVYFACATYQHRTEGKKANQYFVRREQTNVHSLQALYGDIDIKQDEDHHNSIKEALTALQAFCAKTGLPCPTLVRSGRGLHFYWILSEPVGPREWLPVATALKLAMLDAMVAIDSGITTDSARILRPVGTHWRKEEPIRLVKLAYAMPEQDIRPLSWYAEKLSAWNDDSAVAEIFAGLDLENDLCGGAYAPRETLADLVADNCAQVALMRDSQGDVGYDHWRFTIGVLKFCNDPHKLAADWSSRREETGHSQSNWEVKLETWGANPPLCSSFNSCNPGICASCPHFGNIKTPLVLGRTKVAADATIEEPYNLIAGYRWDESRKQMVAQRQVDTDNGPEVQWLPFCDTKYWVHNYILNNGSATLVIHAEHDRPGRDGLIDEHQIDLSVVGGGGRDLNSKLSGYMINDMSGNRQLAKSYLTEYSSYLKRSMHEIATYRQFGWLSDNEFLMGDRIITPTDEREVRLGGQAAAKTGIFDAEKGPQEWIDVVDRIYNRPNGEPYQFVLCAALGSALVPLLGLEEYSGIPIAVTSDESGYGKTTVCWAGLATWGAVRRGLNVLSGDEASLLSIEWQASIFNNIASLFDEQTNRDGQFTSNMLYMLSNGTARARGRPDGQLREMAPSWRGIHFVTGNRNILHKLTENKANPEAAQMRVFEISLDSYPRLDTLAQAQEMSLLVNKIRSGFGKIGVDFIRYVMANRQAVIGYMEQLPGTAFKGLHHDKERFYAYTATCVLTAAAVLQTMGYIRFDLKNLTTWTKRHIVSLRGSVEEMKASTEDNLSRLLLSLSQNILVTDYAGHREELATNSPRGDIAGRLAIKDQKLFITVNAMSDWCMKAGVQWHKFRSALLEEGFFGQSMFDISGRPLSSARFNLSKGVTGYATGSSRVIEIEFSKVAGHVKAELQQDNVLAFGR